MSLRNLLLELNWYKAEETNIFPSFNLQIVPDEPLVTLKGTIFYGIIPRVIELLGIDDVVEILGQEGDWYKVNFKGRNQKHIVTDM